jgi:hypothetical protein
MLAPQKSLAKIISIDREVKAGTREGWGPGGKEKGEMMLHL